jgi:actin-like ATPase involved in cell morphogenesis
MPIKLVFLAFLDMSLGTSDALIFFVGLSLIVLSLPSIVAEKNVTKNVHICSMCIKTN